MLCYRDRWWCDRYDECKSGDTCHRSLTPEVQDAADKWWGEGEGKTPIGIVINPACMIKKEES